MAQAAKDVTRTLALLAGIPVVIWGVTLLPCMHCVGC